VFANPTPNETAPVQEVAARGLSGVLLKNALQKGWQNLDAPTLGYVYDSALPCLRDISKLIRSTSAHIIAKLVTKTQMLQSGSDVLLKLEGFVTQEEDDLLSDGASLAMLFIAEDATSVLDSDEAGRPLNHLIPFWINQANHIKPLLRERALDCIECFFSAAPRALGENVDAFLVALSRLNSDPSAQVRRKVVRALSSLVQYMPDRISKDLFLQMAQFSLTAVEDEEDSVSREGCEFFDVSLADGSRFASSLGLLLPRLVPLLLARMTYKEEELFELEDELKPDAHIADSPMAWKPTFQNGMGAWSSRPADLSRDDDRGRGNEDNEGGGGDGDGMEESPYWTTRRIASLVLDRLSKQVDHRELAPHFLPTLYARLQSAQWRERESAILALGAVAQGGLVADIEPSLPMLFPYLITQSADMGHVLIRRISLWCLSRYAKFFISIDQVLQSALQVILAHFKDNNKSVQASALGALAGVFEVCEGKQVLIPYLKTIVEQMSAALDTLQENNVCHLLDAFTALFRSKPTGEYVRDPALIAIYMPKIWSRFAALTPGDINLPAMTWFLAHACVTLGPNFFPFAEPSLQRCRDIMEESLSLAEAANDIGEPLGFGDFEHLQCTLELLSSLVTALKADFIRSPNAQQCAQMVFQCASYLPDPDVIEVAVGVLGDICVFCPDLLMNASSELVRLLCGIGRDYDTARMTPGPCRNAVWALSELAASRPNVFLPEVLDACVKISCSLLVFREEKAEWAKETADAAALLAGNMFLVSADLFEQAFMSFGQNNSHPVEALLSWTKVLIRMNESLPSRIRTIKSWSLFVTRRPDLVRGSVSLVLVNLASNDMRTQDMEAHQILLQLGLRLKQVYGADDWERKLAPLNESMRKRLAEVYGIN